MNRYAFSLYILLSWAKRDTNQYTCGRCGNTEDFTDAPLDETDAKWRRVPEDVIYHRRLAAVPVAWSDFDSVTLRKCWPRIDRSS